MPTTFLKRQKEMKRLEKQREKAERRAQKKLAKNAGNEVQAEDEKQSEIVPVPAKSGPWNGSPAE